MTRQLHAAVPTSETPGADCKDVRDLYHPLNFLRSTAAFLQKQLIVESFLRPPTTKMAPDEPARCHRMPAESQPGGGFSTVHRTAAIGDCL